jgi:hypothetical protein
LRLYSASSIAGTIFNNQLGKELSHIAVTLSPAMIKAVKESVTVIFTLPQDQQAPVVRHTPLSL